MAQARQQYIADGAYVDKQNKEFTLTQEVIEKLDSIEPGAERNFIQGIKKNGVLQEPDEYRVVDLTIPEVIDNLNSTDRDSALSARQGRVLYNYIKSLQSIGKFLSNWNAATGMPTTNPSTLPYEYHAGDYYIISVLSLSTNYRPEGIVYSGTASSTVETEEIKVGDFYIYDGTSWVLLINTERQIAIDSSLSDTSTNPVENRVITNALNGKQPTLTAGSGIDIDVNNKISNTKPGPTVSTTAPSSPIEGMEWYDSTNDVLKIYDGTAWVTVGVESNTKTFYLSGPTDLTNAQAVWDFMKASSGNTALVHYGNLTYTFVEELDSAYNAYPGLEFHAPYLINYGGGNVSYVTRGIRIVVRNNVVDEIMDTDSVSMNPLNKDNIVSYTPTNDYNPATKKYVDDNTAYVGSSAPSNPTEGRLWYDTINDVLKAYDGTSWNTTGTTYSAGTNVQISAQNVISATDTTYTASDFDIKDLADSTSKRTYWDGKMDGITILTYGTSTWSDFTTAYNANRIVYCKVSSATGYRMAFLAYVNTSSGQENAEFQYYRSLSSHSDTDQGDEVYIYKLTSDGTWSTATRKAYTKVVAGTNMTSSYASGTLTLNATDTTYNTATSSAEGLIKLGSDTQQSESAQTASSTVGRTYPIQLNSNGQAVVNVPWTDNGVSYTGGNGIDITGTTISADTTVLATKSDIANLGGFTVVDTLPSASIASDKMIYLLGPIGTGADKYEEWIITKQPQGGFVSESTVTTVTYSFDGSTSDIVPSGTYSNKYVGISNFVSDDDNCEIVAVDNAISESEINYTQSDVPAVYPDLVEDLVIYIEELGEGKIGTIDVSTSDSELTWSSSGGALVNTWTKVGETSIDLSDLNTKTFYISSTSDLVNAQAAYDWLENGKNPLIIYNNYVYRFAGDAGGYVQFFSDNIITTTSTYTQIDRSMLRLDYLNDAITRIRIQNSLIGKFLSTSTEYYEAYTPLYDGSPATKKYVDSNVTYVGSSAPSSPTEGKLWYDTTNDVLKTYDGSNWNEVGGALSGGVTGQIIRKTSSGTAWDDEAVVMTAAQYSQVSNPVAGKIYFIKES